MKPLELTVHRPFQDRQGNDWYVWGDTCVKPWIADDYSARKRLTDAELAAEVWRLSITARLHEDACEFTAADEYDRQFGIIERFATLPHYDGPTQ